jgi:hypothetical protein
MKFSFLIFTLLTIFALTQSAVTNDDEQLSGINLELRQKAEDVKAKCQNSQDRATCEEVAGGLTQDLLVYLNLVLASSNNTLVSQVAPTLYKSWETVLNITERLSLAADPGERLLDSKLRNLTSLCNQTLHSLTQRTAGFHAAHTSILKAARRSYLPGVCRFCSLFIAAIKLTPVFKAPCCCCSH